MANPLSKLIKKADALAQTAAQLVARSIREVRGELALLAQESNIASSAADREAAYKMIKKRMSRLSLRLARLLEVQHLLAAKTAATAASDMTGLEIKFSKHHAQAVLELVSPAQGANLAAVFTDRMSQNLITTLREAVVATLREQAVTGGSMSDTAHAMQKRWDNALKNSEEPRFTDSAGRVWDTKNYFMMNARTSSMRIYNDCLADDVARETGSDLMRISRHGSDPHCACAAWEGQIISLSGKTKGFPTYEDARRGGCFHPNCVHTLEVVDEVADADEIALQSSHPVNPDLATDPAEQDERKYAIDQERKMKAEGLTQEEARIAVDRDNLTAALRSGLIREDAPDLIKSLTDAQITALCPNGNPPRFVPVKRVRGGTRQKPKYEPEKWRKGSQGGVIHISRDTNAQHLAKVANVENPTSSAPTSAPTGRGSSPLRPAAPATPTPAPKPSSALEKKTAALMKQIGATYTTDPIPLKSVNPNYKLSYTARNEPNSELRIAAQKQLSKQGLPTEAFTHNCQRCVPAYEATRRGYRVEALPILDDNDWLGSEGGSVSMWENKKRTFFRYNPHKTFQQNIEEKMAEWGDGARAEVFAMFRNGGHVFVAEQRNGKTVYIDPQSGDENGERHFRNVDEDNWYNTILRIDNNPFTSNAKKCFKKV